MRLSTAILDVGKTHTKLSVWDAAGQRLEQAVRANPPRFEPTGRVLDTDAIEAWLVATLREMAGRHRIGRIMPVAHGAAAACIASGRRVAPVPDYEDNLPPALSETYDTMRDPFATNGSPALPGGLNLGRQLFGLAVRQPDLMDTPGLQIVTWPEYWTWFLCGVAASERSSLGCHTDLWSPVADDYSPLAGRLGLAERFAPLRRAGEVAGTLRPDLAEETGLSRDVVVHVGVHDSNAGLQAGHGHRELAGRPVTVLSTGTWFIAMHAGGDIAGLAGARDCTVNVTPSGRPVPSARFMGGREAEILMGETVCDLFTPAPGADALAGLLAAEPLIAPAVVKGSGPYGQHQGGWRHAPDARAASAVQLYLAMNADALLRLVGAEGAVVVEGRFAGARLFVEALAALQPRLDILTCTEDGDAAFGALRCLDPAIKLEGRLKAVDPLPVDMTGYRQAWRELAERTRIPA